MRHRCATSGNQQIIKAERRKHAVGQLIKSARTGNGGPPPHHVACHVVLNRPTIDADSVEKACTGKYVVGGELVAADNLARLAHAQLRRDIDNIGIGKTRRLTPQKVKEHHRLVAGLQFLLRSVRAHRFRRQRARLKFLLQ